MTQEDGDEKVPPPSQTHGYPPTLGPWRMLEVKISGEGLAWQAIAIALNDPGSGEARQTMDDMVTIRVVALARLSGQIWWLLHQETTEEQWHEAAWRWQDALGINTIRYPSAHDTFVDGCELARQESKAKG